jgi:hypothetical protein
MGSLRDLQRRSYPLLKHLPDIRTFIPMVIQDLTLMEDTTDHTGRLLRFKCGPWTITKEMVTFCQFMQVRLKESGYRCKARIDGPEMLIFIGEDK